MIKFDHAVLCRSVAAAAVTNSKPYKATLGVLNAELNPSFSTKYNRGQTIQDSHLARHLRGFERLLGEKHGLLRSLLLLLQLLVWGQHLVAVYLASAQLLSSSFLYAAAAAPRGGSPAC